MLSLANSEFTVNPVSSWCGFGVVSGRLANGLGASPSSVEGDLQESSQAIATSSRVDEGG